MPVIKPVSFTTFDPHNPEHVAEIVKVKNGGTRNPNLKFDFPPPFTNGIDYALRLMALAWGEYMAQKHQEIKHVLESSTTMVAADSGSDNNVRQLPVIGLKAKSVETISRTLPPGSTVR